MRYLLLLVEYHEIPAAIGGISEETCCSWRNIVRYLLLLGGTWSYNACCYWWNIMRHVLLLVEYHEIPAAIGRISWDTCCYWWKIIRYLLLLVEYPKIPAANGGRQRMISPGTKSWLATKILKKYKNFLQMKDFKKTYNKNN